VTDNQGGSDATPATATITVNSVNDAPVAQGDKPVTVLEDGANTALGITAPTDVDGDTLTITVTSIPSAAVGTVYLSGGVTAVTNGEVLSAAQLTGLVFRPAANANGAAGTFSYTVDDGHTGTDTQTVTLGVTAVNDAPVAQGDKPVTVLEDAANTALGITAPTDVDGDTLTITVTSIPNAAVGTVYLSGGITAVTNGEVLSAAELTGLVFRPAANANGAAGTFSYTVDDGHTGTDTQTVTLSVTALDDAPVNSVPGAQAINEDATLTFTGGKAITISDVDAGSSDVKVTLHVDTGSLDVVNIPGGLVVTGDNSANVTLTGTVTEINTGLNGLIFTPTLDFNGVATLTVTTDDQGATGTGGPLSDVDPITINIAAVNDAPVNSVPGTQTVDDDLTLTFDTGHGNKISISDVDAGTDNVQVTLSVDGGALHVDDVNTLISAGSNDSNTITLTGSQSAINTELNGLVYTPTPGLTGATLHVATDDLSQNGSGGNKTDDSTVTITVNAHLTGTGVGESLAGGAGNDTITGAGGDDTLSGGGGNNHFVYSSTADGTDTITDFQAGSGKDVINIHDILTGVGDPMDLDTAGFVQITGTPSAATISVDANGGGDGFVALATLSGVNGVTTTVDDLVANGNLVA
jgi:hypothetical protein